MCLYFSLPQKLMTVRELSLREESTSPSDGRSTSKSPCKRQRLEEVCKTTPSGCVEDILRDISVRCNAVLHHNATGPPLEDNTESIHMYGAFLGLQTSISTGGAVCMEGMDMGDSGSSFCTSIREHCTIRTQAFPHGHVFTSRTPQGGYRFRWVPSQS